ncbi:hypothetical protein H0H81_008624 [Sphagnurus paluster]|uniref:DUF4220 domain-containing protein n=1 Tax=Sphagnurus paluster TaxID=117069 RepID=A0A9P7GJY3_9AGAR|nr:hypothetical protein H0H81_008624 [Sphagnurus paluster]
MHFSAKQDCLGSFHHSRTILLIGLLLSLAYETSGFPVISAKITATSNPPTPTAIQWSSVSVTALLAILQGIISAFVSQCVAARWWTIRFWILRYEHVWWTIIIAILCTSLALDTAFIIQTGQEDSAALLLTSASIGVVLYRYLVTSWAQAKFRKVYWLAWTGRSRTRVQDHLVTSLRAERRQVKRAARRVPVGHVEWGAAFFGGVWGRLSADPTDVLQFLAAQKNCTDPEGRSNGIQHRTPQPNGEQTVFGFVYPSLEGGAGSVAGTSLLWAGKHSLFARRVSRAVDLIDGDMWRRIAESDGSYSLRWAALAHGILGRNKGLDPFVLEAAGFASEREIVNFEKVSSLGPRPAKTKRSMVRRHMNKVYSVFGEKYCVMATELALLLEDVGEIRVAEWLRDECEHQDWQLACTEGKDPARGRVFYRLSYVAMLASLNFGPGPDGYVRPELLVATYLGHQVENGWSPRSSPQRIEKEETANPGCTKWLASLGGLEPHE